MATRSPWWVSAVAAAVVVFGVVWGRRVISGQLTELHAVMNTALLALRDRDFGLRLTVHGDTEIAEIKRLYNQLADAARADRADLLHRETLLESILQRSPVSVMLLNQGGRIVYSNNAARLLLAAGERLNDRRLDELDLAHPMRDALASGADGIVHVIDETFHVTQREFLLNTQHHRLVLIERLTPELRRQEVDVWKRAIRVINHELNNTIAPISSLFHSARLAQATPDRRHRVDEIYRLIEERLAHLRQFLDAYAVFARLPEPRKQLLSWRDLLDPVLPLFPLRVEGQPDLACLVDEGQMQQVVINLVKNAHESGSAPEDVVAVVGRAGRDDVLQVLDRGRGMTDEEIRQAMRPFYSTKPGGSGVGLALCTEIVEAHGGQLFLQAREGGGTVATVRLPGSD